MNDKQKQAIHDQAKQWILEAGRQIREKIDEPLYVDTKANPNDLVTQMDKNTEKFFVERIKKKYPDHFLLSEEGFGDDVKSLDGTIWIIDPIDGTMNFVHQKRNFAISVGIFQDGIGEIGFVYDVMEDVLYSAIKGKGAYKNEKKLPQLDRNKPLEESIIIMNSFWSTENSMINNEKIQAFIKKVRGTRSYGSAAIEFAYIAEGIADGYISMNLKPWDIAAGLILVHEVGGVTTKADGQEINMLGDNTVLSSNQVIHNQIQHYIELKKQG